MIVVDFVEVRIVDIRYTLVLEDLVYGYGEREKERESQQVLDFQLLNPNKHFGVQFGCDREPFDRKCQISQSRTRLGHFAHVLDQIDAEMVCELLVEESRAEYGVEAQTNVHEQEKRQRAFDHVECDRDENELEHFFVFEMVLLVLFVLDHNENNEIEYETNQRDERKRDHRTEKLDPLEKVLNVIEINVEFS